MVGRFPDGVWLAELAGVADPGLAGAQVMGALGVRQAGDMPVLEALIYRLQSAELLVLDNREHLLDACAQLAAALLHAAPGLRVLRPAVSRYPGSGAGIRTHNCGYHGWRLVPFNLDWYHESVALNIKDPETERLAAEVAALTGTTKTGAVRYALRQVLQAQSHRSVRQREERLTRFLEEEIWPLVPPDQPGKPVSKAEREKILGFGQHGA